MLSLLSVIFAACFTMLVQTTLLPSFEIANVRPDLALIVIIYVAIYFEDKDAIPVAFIFGLLQDSILTGAFGLHTLINCSIVLLAMLLKKIFYSDDIIAGYMVAFTIIVIEAFVSAYLANYLWIIEGKILFGRAFAVILINSLVVVPLFLLINYIYERYTFIAERFRRI